MQARFVIVSERESGTGMAIAQSLDVEMGRCGVDRFPDTEISVQLDEPVREREVFVDRKTTA
jgi:phosphoribosylpyrophosphate synthetase